MAGTHDAVVHICRSRDDDDILTSRLRRQRRPRFGTEDLLSRVGAACKDDMLDLRSLRQFGQCVPFRDDDLQCLFRHAGIPESLGKEPGHRSSHGSRFEDDGITGSQSSHNATAWDGAWEVPRRDDEHRAFGLDVDIVQGIELLHRGSIETAVVDTF